MSTPFGLDLGNNNSVLAVARNRGIDVVVNEVSNRSTPSLVGFGPRNRYLGESGKTKQTSNVKNTVENLKRIIGLKFKDPEFDIENKFFTSKLVQLKNGKVGVEVEFGGKTHVFSATQLTAMFIDKVKHTVQEETKSSITDVCLAVPVWYSEEQRYNIADAARIAGLNPVRIVNDVTAAAVSYGVFKNDLPGFEEKPRIIGLVDIGHSTYTCSIMAFRKGEMKVLGTAYDKHFGGRDFDHAITEHFADQFKDKYKIDIRKNPKAYNRILIAAEKLKKVLSANTTAPFSVESVMDDIDVSSQLSREELEELVEPLLKRVTYPITNALAQAKLTVNDIDFVEIIGGTTRIPVLKKSISDVFGKPLSSTLNQDEAVAKGAAFICAIHSPTLRVRPFKFEDIDPYSVSYTWDKQVDDEDRLEVFPANSSYPSTKLITLHRTGDFNMKAVYTHPSKLPKGTSTTIAKWSFTGVNVPKDQDFIPVKVKLRCDPSGLHIIENAYTTEDITVQEPVPLPEDAPEDAEPQFKEVTKTIKKDVLGMTAKTFALNPVELNDLIEKENELRNQDKLVAETEDRKNALEEYIYTLRAKLDDEYSDFASDAEKEKLKNMLATTENWLYGDGDDSTKAKYIAKYEELASLGNIIRGRYLAKEEEKRQALRANQETSKMNDIAEKLAEQRRARAASDDSDDNNDENMDLD
ncbi:AHL_G0003620.mRNA.1.CDS.1 [Saccharomyces cerevisiae]|nr:Sse2p [Saccharomyces cerevisiae YJM1252]CAI4866189.1 AHL_G0003620.mRNA.1.CDS.1 [Saccharomyces cerevisiae]CAI6499606.1 AHL_G0003620.mRNA.1.CDS.1 [Saccharomyces cerevisiae]